MHARTEKDPRDYLGITISDDELPTHVDGYFIVYANHSTVLLIWDSESKTVKRAHHAYVDECNVRVAKYEKLTINSILLQDPPPSVLNDKGILNPKQIKLASSALGETKH